MDSFFQRKEYNLYFFLFLLSGTFLFFFSKGTSPLFSHSFYGHDGAIFISLGKALLEGKIPYVDFFDHKGPVIIFIEAFGQLFISGRNGIFIFQIFNLFFILIIIYRIGLIFVSETFQNLLLLFTFLLFFRFTIVEGNSTEEYSLLPIILAIYITIEFYFNNKEINIYRSVLLGFCFFIPFWMRANNAGMVCACIIFILIILLEQRKIKQFLKVFSSILLTCLVLTGLLLFYFYSNDALFEMIYGTFLFNFKYGASGGFFLRTFLLFLLFSFIVIIIFISGTYFLYRKTKDKNLLLFAGLLLLLGYIPICLGKFFAHYLTLILPLLLLGILFLIRSRIFSKYLDKINLVSLIFLIIGITISFLFKRNENNMDESYKFLAEEIVGYIPVYERNNVFCYSVSPRFYVITNLNPYFKYFILQESHGFIDNNIFSEINDAIEVNRPLWIITEGKKIPHFINKDFEKILKENYILYIEKNDNMDSLQLYCLKEKIG